MKMWAGRFSKEEDKRVNDFNSSISFDSRMFRADIEGSIAHATMLGKCGIISPTDCASIITELHCIAADIESGDLPIDFEAEDIHMFIEGELTKRIGDAGRRLHTARSRNDQVALDIRIYLLSEIENVKNLTCELLRALTLKAGDELDTVMPGYTHMQRAQPVTFAHYMMAYAQMFMRDVDRLCDCSKRTAVMPLGSGALASTTYPLDREYTAKLLGFPKITDNSIDGVSDRDFVMELSSVLSMLMVHLSRFSEEIILWCSSEFSFIELDDAYSTGSSIMPQKKNPDVAELVRGKSARVIGDMQTLFTMMKSLPLAYNKDMQEDKEAIFDAVDTAKLCLELFTAMFSTMTVKRENMRKAASHGFINATDCADYLVRKGLPFRTAYKIVGTLVAKCIELGTTLEELPLGEYRKCSEVFDADVYEAINLEKCVADRKVKGGPAPDEVTRQIGVVQKFIKDNYTNG